MKDKKKTYQDYRIEDFLTDESFIRWAKGAESDIAWEAIFEQYPHLIPLAEEAKDTISVLNFSEIKVNKQRTSDLLQKINKRIEKQENGGKEANIVALHGRYEHYRPQRNNGWKWVAAMMTGIGLFISFLFLQRANQPSSTIPQIAFLTKTTQMGQKLTTRLSDGTIVMLNAGSSIKCEEVFNDTVRYVTLEGEAFFDVAKDSRPFRVKANGTLTTALGTSFNIKQNGDKVSISLVTGKVGVNMQSKEGMEESTLLIPGEQVAVEIKDEIRFVKGKFDVSEVLAWKRGILSFRHVGSEEVWEELEKWYGVEVVLINKQVANQAWDYTGSFDNESLENVLGSIGFVKDFEFKIEDDKVIIY
ncbi:FecR domain-containing protein [Echinicola sp. CAU 1574]|uniref:FecR domain-containing protein n=1 Tax=Echinicola arenosa TaxID=2774144 RepID=A0ABR9AGE8_9BACT|nr:FecR domain-containing protein [Echinicola arenosa]MBD8487822.1 FecR domain-containing protein [Echinicola arenosa]